MISTSTLINYNKIQTCVPHLLPAHVPGYGAAKNRLKKLKYKLHRIDDASDRLLERIYVSAAYRYSYRYSLMYSLTLDNHRLCLQKNNKELYTDNIEIIKENSPILNNYSENL